MRRTFSHSFRTTDSYTALVSRKCDALSEQFAMLRAQTLQNVSPSTDSDTAKALDSRLDLHQDGLNPQLVSASDLEIWANGV